MSDRARVYVARPFYQAFVGQCVSQCDNCCKPPTKVIKVEGGDAFLARNFNALWCDALNRRDELGLTHFCMIHCDVSPKTPYWLDVMIQEQQRVGADLLSIVLPIKSYHGLTSTAILDPQSNSLRRLTMHEIWNDIKETTFDAEQAGFPSCKLLASTGLWIADFTKPWIEETYFNVQDKIVRLPDDTFDYVMHPEDWFFSMMLHDRGAKVVASKCVNAGHWGTMEFRNDTPWGTITHDDDVSSVDWLTIPSSILKLP